MSAERREMVTRYRYLSRTALIALAGLLSVVYSPGSPRDSLDRRELDDSCTGDLGCSYSSDSCASLEEYYKCIGLQGCIESVQDACLADLATSCDTDYCESWVYDDDSTYPPDLLFSKPYAKADGKWKVLFHILGILYMLSGLSIAVDEYFVTALNSMVAYWDVKEDVAGATFMAAGGSAPELFTSLMGVFVSKSDVGFGTIVGSAVFNVLFVIGMCAVFAKTVLVLTWWPLFRDCSCYILGLTVLSVFVYDQSVYVWEALILFGMYLLYITVMIFNEALELFFSKLFGYDTKESSKVIPSEKDEELREANDEIDVTGLVRRFDEESVKGDARGTPKDSQPPSRRNSLPRSESNNYAVSVKAAVRCETVKAVRRGSYGQELKHAIEKRIAQIHERGGVEKLRAATNVLLIAQRSEQGPQLLKYNLSEMPSEARLDIQGEGAKKGNGADEEDDNDDPFQWPDGLQERIFFLVNLPLVFSLWLTIPNCRNERWKSFFIITFVMSLIWIAFFSYFLVWWATIWGKVTGIPDVVMGLTFLAAGTSVPDLLSSVIMARLGEGDMAVSSSIGSNVFDILVGLPIPWILKTGIVSPGSFITVQSDFLIINVLLLLLMVFLVIASIILCKWHLNHTLGGIMGFLYIFFLVSSIFLEVQQPSWAKI